MNGKAWGAEHPGPPSSASASFAGNPGDEKLSPVARVVAVLAICAPLLAPLCVPDLQNPDEGRYAEIGREMAATGDWIVPRLHGVPHWAKPPLTYWAIGASLRAFGTTEWAARLPAAIAGTITLLASWFLARRMGGPGVALLAVVMLAAMLEFNLLARTATADIVQTAFITWAAAFAWSARTPRGDAEAARSWHTVATRLAPFACLGIAFVAKGPVGLGIFFSGLLVYLALRPRATILSWRQLLPGLVVTFAIGLPWFLIVRELHPDLTDFFLEGEVRDRVLTAHGRGKAFWFYPVVLTIGTMPWTAAVAPALAGIIRSIRAKEAPTDTGDAGRFILAWIAGPFLLFSISGSKLPTYLLPLMPICAIAAARWIASIPDVSGAHRGWMIALVAAPPLIAIGAAIAAITAFGAEPPGWMILAGTVSIAGGAIIARIRTGGGIRPRTAVGSTAILMLGLMWSTAYLAGDPSVDLKAHAGHAWIREALAHQPIRGLPVGSRLRPEAETRPTPTPSFATYHLRANSLAFYALGLSPEYVPTYGFDEPWEMESDQDRARAPTLGDLAVILRSAEPVHVLTTANHIPELTAAVGHPLSEVRRCGRGPHAVILVANH